MKTCASSLLTRLLLKNGSPIGCDTFVAFPPAAPPNTVIFGKNSDRPTGEGQSVTKYSAVTSTSAETKCTYISIPAAEKQYAVLLSQIDWMFGAEMGSNEHGVVIGNEAVWTVEPDGDEALLGMDLVRLGLERGATAKEALTVMTNLLETHGQGGACAENDPSFTYHNSYLIVDRHEAYVLETAGKHWVAERITKGVRNISNGLTVRTNYSLHSKGLHEHAIQRGLWNGKGELDFAKCFSQGPLDEESSYSRLSQGCRLLNEYDNKGTLTAHAMMEILKDHDSGICMHGGGFETTASMVSELKQTPGEAHRHWMTGKPHPCSSPFEEYFVPQR